MNPDPLLITLKSDLIDNILEYASDIKKCAESITSQIREMIGAQIVAVFERDPDGVYRLLDACPRRKRTLFNEDEMKRLVASAGGFEQSTVIEPGKGDAGLILSGSGLKESFVVPLRVGEESFGFLFLLDLMDNRGIQKILDALRDISALLSLIFKNSFLYRNMESKVEQRTKALLESEAKHRLFFENAGDVIFIHDVQAKILAANPMACERLGYTHAELMSMTIGQVDTQEEAQKFPDRTAWLMEHGHLMFETVHRHKDGITIPTEVSTRLIAWEGKPAAMSICRDITERKRAEKALHMSEVHYRSLFDNSLIGVVVTDKNLVFADANEAFCKMLGYSKEEVIGKMTTSDITHPDDVVKSLDMVSKLTSHVIDNYSLEKRYVSKTGQTIPALIYVKCHYNLDEEYIGTTASILDISERKRADGLLLRNEEKYRALFNNAEIAMFRTRLDGSETLEANQKFLDLVGMTGEDVLGSPSVILWADPKEREEMVRRLVANGSVSEFEFKMLHKQKGIRNCLTSLKLYRGQGILEGSISDITERRLAEEEKEKMQALLNQAQKMEAIGTLAGGIAHDFNNILGAILGYAEMAYEDSLSGLVKPSDLDQVVEASHRAKDLVKQILAFSRQADTQKIPLRPATLVKESIKLLRSSIPTTIDIQQDIDPETDLILADPTQIHQIAMNLCTNAYHAMEETGGTLSISLKNKVLAPQDLVSVPDVQPGNFVQLSIGDTGSGIKPEIQARIFDPYFTTKEAGKGTGMGLAIVHGIAKSYGGFITCHSEIGAGTVFEISLPAIFEQVAPEAQEVQLIPVGSERILFIDDEEILAKMGQTMLERLGYKVTVQMNSIEALAVFKDQPEAFDLVITDQTMPGMTGFDLARRMLQIRPDLPIILCTGYSSQISEDKVRSYGIKGFALKPLARKNIAVLIRKILDEGKSFS